jgi:predicted enzyme related to lactoylglutathione lyase
MSSSGVDTVVMNVIAPAKGPIRGVGTTTVTGRVVAATKGAQMLRGLTTVSFFAADLAAAKKWYAELLGIDPYFERPLAGPPAYIEFRLGDYQHELGVIDSRYAPHGSAAGPAGAVVYWHVDDVTATFEKLLSMGAKEHEAPVDREAGFITASVIDPFGNILGIMYNPHYLEVLGSTRKA